MKPGKLKAKVLPLEQIYEWQWLNNDVDMCTLRKHRDSEHEEKIIKSKIRHIFLNKIRGDNNI